MEDNQLIDQVSEKRAGQIDLPSSGGTLAMGIVSIVLFSGIFGLILAILTITRTKKALYDYSTDPEGYTLSSYKRMKAARICAIVSLSMLGTMILILLMVSAAD